MVSAWPPVLLQRPACSSRNGCRTACDSIGFWVEIVVTGNCRDGADGAGAGLNAVAPPLRGALKIAGELLHSVAGDAGDHLVIDGLPGVFCRRDRLSLAADPHHACGLGVVDVPDPGDDGLPLWTPTAV